MNGIPVLDMSRFGEDEAKDMEIADALGRIFREHGFVSIVGHGVPESLIARCFELAREVFLTGMTLEERLHYEFPLEGHQMGFTPVDTEVSVGQTRANRMAFWHVNDPESIVRNEFPCEVPQFGPVALELHAALKRCAGGMILKALAMHLGRDPNFFGNWIAKGENLLRVIHYPALDGSDPEVPRSGEHEDINLVTLLVPSDEPGLQVKTRSGEWLDANNPAGSVIVNPGDMMQMHTFGEIPSVTHRVINPRAACRDRFSMPIFIHPEVTQPLVTAGAYKFRRLRQIKLIDPLPDNQIDY